MPKGTGSLTPTPPPREDLPPMPARPDAFPKLYTDRQRIDVLLDEVARCRRALRHLYELTDGPDDPLMFETWVQALADDA